MDTKKKYRILRAIAYDGARDRGSLIELTEKEARNIGGEYLEELPDKKAAPDSAPVTTGVPKVEEEAVVKPKARKKK